MGANTFNPSVPEVEDSESLSWRPAWEQVTYYHSNFQDSQSYVSMNEWKKGTKSIQRNGEMAQWSEDQGMISSIYMAAPNYL